MALIQCPDCNREVSSSAPACPGCGRPLAAAAPVAAAAPGSKRNDETLGILLLGIPLVGAALIWFWIGQMNLLRGPGSSLTLVTVGVIAGTAVLAAVEASQLGMGTGKVARRETGPMAWFFGMVLVWFIGFPAYLFARRRYGRRNLLVGAILVAALFVASVALIGNAILQKQAEVGRLLGG